MSPCRLTTSCSAVASALGLGAPPSPALGLVACGDAEAPAPAAEEEASEETKLDAAAYDELVASGAVAPDDVVAASAWATAVKEAGTLRVGGVQDLAALLVPERAGRRDPRL